MSLIRRDKPEAPIATREDPVRWMRDLLRWEPFGGQTWLAPERAAFVPAFDVKETKDSFQFKADLPGIKEADVEIKITGNRLVVSGKREAEHEDKADTYYAYERSYGAFQRAFALPDGVDTEHVHAELKDGVLMIALPKKAMAQTRTVAIKTGDEKKS